MKAILIFSLFHFATAAVVFYPSFHSQCLFAATDVAVFFLFFGLRAHLVTAAAN